MIKQLFLFGFFALPFISFSQTETGHAQQVKFAVLRPLSFLNPGLEFSYEKFTSKNWSSQLAFGISVPSIGPLEKLKGYNLGFEEKYFFSLKPSSGKYLSLELNHSSIKYAETASARDTVNNTNIQDPFTISRKFEALAFKYGVQYYRNDFVMDVSIGAGIKYFNVEHHDRTLEYKGPREPFDLYTSTNRERKRFDFYLPFNFRIGYYF